MTARHVIAATFLALILQGCGPDIVVVPRAAAPPAAEPAPPEQPPVALPEPETTPRPEPEPEPVVEPETDIVVDVVEQPAPEPGATRIISSFGGLGVRGAAPDGALFISGQTGALGAVLISRDPN